MPRATAALRVALDASKLASGSGGSLGSATM